MYLSKHKAMIAANRLSAKRRQSVYVNELVPYVGPYTLSRRKTFQSIHVVYWSRG